MNTDRNSLLKALMQSLCICANLFNLWFKKNTYPNKLWVFGSSRETKSAEPKPSIQNKASCSSRTSWFNQQSLSIGVYQCHRWFEKSVSKAEPKHSSSLFAVPSSPLPPMPSTNLASSPTPFLSPTVPVVSRASARPFSPRSTPAPRPMASPSPCRPTPVA